MISVVRHNPTGKKVVKKVFKEVNSDTLREI